MNPAVTLVDFNYPVNNLDGTRTTSIDREWTHKRDPIKDYSESMYKVASMRRVYKS